MKQLVILLLLLAATCFPISSRAGDPIKKWAVIRADGSVAHDLSMWDYPQIRPLSSNLVEVTYKVQNLQRVSPVLLDQPVEPQLENWCDSVMVHPEGIVVCSRGRYLKLFSQDMEPLVSFAPDNETYIRRYLGEGFFVGVTKKENRESHALYRINEGRPELISSRYGPEFGRFMDGVCPVARNGHWGMIDAQGKLIISWLYDRPFRLQDGVAFVERDGEPYWINQNGIRVAAPDKSVAARIEVQTPELGSNSWVVAEHNRILTPTIEGWSITDLDGKIIMPPSPYWLDLVPGDNGLILAASEKGWGYLDMDGKEVIAPNYPYASPFVDGIAVVQTIFSDPVLAVFPYPQRWFFENIDKNRNFSIYSLARPGEKYGMVYAGQMKDGVPHGVGTICWPGRGKVPVTMSHGKLLDMRVATLEDGTKVIGSIDETLSGRGYDNYPNGKMRFTGLWKNGKPWKGERFLIDEPGYVMVVENGKDVQKLAKYVMTDSKPQTASTKKTATQYEVICSACYGTGTIEGRGRWVDETKQSRILAGSKGYMEGYTHYEWETGNKVYVSGTSVQCSKCNGKGRYFQ